MQARYRTLYGLTPVSSQRTATCHLSLASHTVRGRPVWLELSGARYEQRLRSYNRTTLQEVDYYFFYPRYLFPREV